MQHDEKLGTMKLIMLSSKGGYHDTTILILILMPQSITIQWVINPLMADSPIQDDFTNKF
jgi:homoserine trans-succinylase